MLRRLFPYCASLLPLALVASCSSDVRPPPSAEQSRYDAGAAAKDAASTDANLEAGADGGGVEGGVSPVAFDPKRVYLRGTLIQSVGLVAVADLATPNAFVVGAELGFFPAVTPSGDLLYTQDEGPERKIRTFAPDPPPTLQGTAVTNYPAQPYANDPVVSVPVCPTTVSSFVVRPDTGKLVYVCNGSGDARDDTGAVVGAGCTILTAAGYGKSLYCGGSTIDAAGVSHVVTGLEQQLVITVRAKLGGGFWVATVAKPDELLADRGYHLFEVTNEGVATLKYDYPKRADFKPALFDFGGTMALDGDARLYRLGALAAAPTVDVVARFDQNAVEIVYTATNATVKANPVFTKLFTTR